MSTTVSQAVSPDTAAAAVAAAAAEEEDNPLIAPCLCTGSSKYVHRNCLERWRAASPAAFYKCTICNHPYRFKTGKLATVLRSPVMPPLVFLLMMALFCYVLGFLPSWRDPGDDGFLIHMVNGFVLLGLMGLGISLADIFSSRRALSFLTSLSNGQEVSSTVTYCVVSLFQVLAVGILVACLILSNLWSWGVVILAVVGCNPLSCGPVLRGLRSLLDRLGGHMDTSTQQIVAPQAPTRRRRTKRKAYLQPTISRGPLNACGVHQPTPLPMPLQAYGGTPCVAAADDVSSQQPPTSVPTGTDTSSSVSADATPSLSSRETAVVTLAGQQTCTDSAYSTRMPNDPRSVSCCHKCLPRFSAHDDSSDDLDDDATAAHQPLKTTKRSGRDDGRSRVVSEWWAPSARSVCDNSPCGSSAACAASARASNTVSSADPAAQHHAPIDPEATVSRACHSSSTYQDARHMTGNETTEAPATPKATPPTTPPATPSERPELPARLSSAISWRSDSATQLASMRMDRVNAAAVPYLNVAATRTASDEFTNIPLTEETDEATADVEACAPLMGGRSPSCREPSAGLSNRHARYCN